MWIDKLKNKPTEFDRKQYLEQLFDSKRTREAAFAAIKAWNAEANPQEQALASFAVNFLTQLQQHLLGPAAPGPSIFNCLWSPTR